MKIPNKVQLMGETIKVTIDKDLAMRTDAFGQAHHRFNEIKINYNDNKEIMEHTFFHELTHMVLDKMNEQDLSGNEKFVNLFGGLLYQALKDMK